MNTNRFWKSTVSLLIAVLIFASQLFMAGTAFAQPASPDELSTANFYIPTFTAVKSFNILRIQVSDFPADSVYNVKVKPAGADSTDWQKVGILIVDDEGEGDERFTLDSNYLIRSSRLDVCLKDVASSKNTCMTTPSSALQASSSDLGLSAAKVGNILTIQVWTFPRNTTYFVKVKPVDASIKDWEKIGILHVNTHGQASKRIVLPTNALRGAVQLDVCLKNARNDTVVCTKTEETISGPQHQGRFTAAASGNTLSIHAWDFPKNSWYFVKVRPVSSPESDWYRIGVLQMTNRGAAEKDFRLQDKVLRDAAQLEVCLKNLGDDGVFCIVIGN